MNPLRPLAALALLSALAGCVTAPEPMRALTAAERGDFLKGAKVPEVYGLTVYRSDDGPIFAGAHRLHHEQIALLPFVDGSAGAPPVVEMHRLGSDPVPVLVDTTSRDNWTTLDLRYELRGTPLGPPGFGRTADHVLDDLGGMLYVVPTIALEDSLLVENALFYARAATGPLGPVARWVDRPQPRAVMGTAMLRAFPLLQLDFPRRRLLLASSQDYQPAGERLVASLPLLEERGALAALGSVEGRPVKLLIDTAGDFELAMKDPPAPTLRQVSAGDLVFRQVAVESAFDLGLGMIDFPRIGRRLLDRFIITIDYRKKLIHFERPADL